MNWAKLNIFQRLARDWDEMHPYNAAQVMVLAARPDLAKLTSTWRETLSDLGLGRIEERSHHYRFETLNGDASRCTVPHHNSDTSLEALLSRELNRRFEDDSPCPMRPFVLEHGQRHYLGVVYQHWIADSASIRVLLREWFCRLSDPGRARRTALRVPHEGYWDCFGPLCGRWRIGESLLSSLRWTSRMRRVSRVERPGFSDYAVRFTVRPITDGLSQALREAARRHGATLNDVFLAATAQVCEEFQIVTRTPRRRDMALGTIVDLRARTRADMSDVFGLFLGFTSCICRPRDFESFSRLLGRIAAQNRAHKHAGAPEASMIRMLAGLVAHRVLEQRRLPQFYRKRLPLAGGVSNVNLTGSWVEDYHPQPLVDYIRASPCGPMMPLVFTPTTIGKRMNIGLTCRMSLLPPDCAAAISQAFEDRLVRFAQGLA